MPRRSRSPSSTRWLVVPGGDRAALLKNPLGQIFAFDYAVTGSWSDPKVAKIAPAGDAA